MRVRRFATLVAVLFSAVGAWAVIKETVLHTFGGGIDDGSFALDSGSLAHDTSGNLYGTTVEGGEYGFGAVFELKSDGTETLLHSFKDTDGKYPYAGVILDSSGAIYGTTPYGGSGCRPGHNPSGVVFKLAKSKQGSWIPTILHNFCGGTRDGALPVGGVILGPPGKKGCCYGATENGGASDRGTVFEISSSGKFTVLHSFRDQRTDGQIPMAGLTLGKDGNLFGTTYYGGSSGLGTVFELVRSSSGWTQTVLHSFAGVPDGAYPQYGSLTFDQAGKIIFGVTSNGGQSNNGTVFELTLGAGGGWTETVLHSFRSGSDGATPYGSLASDANGNLYGTTQSGGTSRDGVVFELTRNRKNKTWSETVLYSFRNGKDGAFPQSGVVIDSTGSLFGVTYAGGKQTVGIAYKIVQQARSRFR